MRFKKAIEWVGGKKFQDWRTGVELKILRNGGGCNFGGVIFVGGSVPHCMPCVAIALQTFKKDTFVTTVHG